MGRWELVKRRWLRKYLPRYVDFFIRMSAWLVQRKIKDKPLRILVDTNILRYGVTHETAKILKTINWAGQETIVEIGARIPVYALNDNPDDPNDQKIAKLKRNVSFLAVIAHLARNGTLELCTSPELNEERLRLHSGFFHGSGIFDYQIFKGIQFSEIGRGDLGQHGYIAESILKTNFKELSKIRQQERLKGSTDLLFHDLTNLLSASSNLDAWHVITAERHEMFCFLTMDFALVEKIRKYQSEPPVNTLKTKILTPEEFGEMFELLPVHPNLLSYHNS